MSIRQPFVACVSLLLAGCGGRGFSIVDWHEESGRQRMCATRDDDGTVLRVATLNLAHGRADGFHQSLTWNAAIEANLRTVGAVLCREQPHVVALQEADGPSSWSGGFDHVEHLATEAAFPFSFRGTHADWGGNQYGTALLAAFPLENEGSVAFDANWRDTKGFVRATVQLPAAGAPAVEVVSVHLDFLRDGVRSGQIRRMVEELRERTGPLVVMGDMNCDWDPDGGCVASLAKQLGLAAHAPGAGEATFPSDAPSRRLDWILASPELAFVSQHTLDDALSDHRAVVAELRWTGNE